MIHKVPNKKTKIVATIGPKTETQAQLEKLLKLGLNVVRMNFSHGDFEEHQAKVDNGKKASKATGLPIAFLQDLGGPKIRTGEFDTESGRVTIKKGQTFTLTTKAVKGDESICSINYKKLPKEAKVGDRIMLDDGKKQLKVTKIQGEKIITKVIKGGELKGKRGVNLPDTDISISSLTPKDKKDLEFGIKNDVDFIALSFVRKPKDVKDLRKILDAKKSKAQIISKIETPQAIENIDEILELSDGLMVARGDLAVEVPAEKVPMLQKMLIEKCNEAGKPVITATQMLESMITNPVPTRAEVSDIANAILDGTDAIMLSEETTLGDYPLEAVEVMTRVAERTEENFVREVFYQDGIDYLMGTGDSVTVSAVKNAIRLDAKYIVTITYSGYNARAMSRHKPTQPILVMTPKQKTFNQIQLSWGCHPIEVKEFKSFGDAMKEIRKYLLTNKLAKTGDKVVICTSMPFGEFHEPNAMVVETL
jgi:pyruvate kinase